MNAIPGLLAKSDLNLPPGTRLDDIAVEPFDDHTGEAALRVTVILQRGTNDSDLAWEKLEPIHDEVLRVLASKDPLRRFPYFTYLSREDVEASEAVH